MLGVRNSFLPLECLVELENALELTPGLRICPGVWPRKVLPRERCAIMTELMAEIASAKEGMQ
jgi:hypothetical protein